jgi:2-polyprenyl-3-methyl-5-hydroxy-6-metoxy-1,4-benzoquinol methylase
VPNPEAPALNNHLLVKLFGFPATLIHGDTLVLDRWLFLRRNLPRVPSGSKRLLEIGCGSGAFTIGAARRGYQASGLSWDNRNQQIAAERASLSRARTADFEICDVRHLDRLTGFQSNCDVVVCCETIEHIIDDEKLMRDMARCLKPSGKLLLTTPNYDYKPMGGDEGPFSPIEDGRHVRRGYTRHDLEKLCGTCGLLVSEIAFCSGFLSQKETVLFRALTKIHPLMAWTLVSPLRILPPLLDKPISSIGGWPGYSITLVATKP